MDVLKKTSRSDIEADVSEVDLDVSATEGLRRVTPARDAREKRRTAVAATTAERGAARVHANGALVSDSLAPSADEGQSTAQFSSTPALKRVSPLSRREPTQRPKWQPTTCTAPGVTCGGGGDGSNGGGGTSKLEIRSDSELDTEQLPLRLAKREAQPLPKMPKWWPLLCTSFGITCGDSGTSNGNSNGNSTSDSNGGSNTELSPASTTKREAEPMPMAEAQPEPSRIPKWEPTSCTSRGITCGDSSSVGQSADGGNTGADSASSAASQGGAGGQPEKRDAEAAADFHADGLGTGTFADDDGDVIEIERDSTLAT
jgi:hypothetical protein